MTGESLMLPVRMAALRGRPCGLPHYDVLRILATGAFDEQFSLADVELRPKVEAAGKQFRDVVFFGPDVPREVAGCKYFRSLESGLDEQSVFQRIRDELERMPGCVKMNRDYALKRLPDISCRSRELLPLERGRRTTGTDKDRVFPSTRSGDMA